MKIYFIIEVVVISTLCFSCGSGKIIYPYERNDMNINENYIEGKRNYDNYLKIKASNKIRMDEGKEFNFNSNIGIIRDSLLIVSIIPMAGVEIFRIYCDKDSIIIINREEKTYFQDSLNKYLRTKQIEFDLNDIIALLANEFFIYGRIKNDINEINRMEESRKIGVVQYKGETDNRESFGQVIYYNKLKGSIERIMISKENKIFYMNIVYRGKEKIKRLAFPEYISAEIVNEKNKLFVEMKIKRVEFEEVKYNRIKIPENYKRVEL
jgi:hypothetical protein